MKLAFKIYIAHKLGLAGAKETNERKMFSTPEQHTCFGFSGCRDLALNLSLV